MDEVVGGLDPLERGPQAVGVADVTADRLTHAGVGLGVAGHRADGVTGLDEGLAQVGADEPGGSGDQDAGRRHRWFPSAGGGPAGRGSPTSVRHGTDSRQAAVSQPALRATISRRPSPTRYQTKTVMAWPATNRSSQAIEA